MGAEGPTESHWEVLGSDRRRSELPSYRPAAHDSSDGITLRGEAKLVGGRDWTRIRTATIGAVFIGLTYRVLPLTGWLVVSGVILLGYAVGIWLYKPKRQTSWKAPIVVVNREGITAQTVDGLTHSATWSELGELRARSVEGEKGNDVHLTWVRPSGAHIVADLGDTIDRGDLCRAIVSRAPQSMTLHLGEHEAFGDD
jgi:hypothetical protein